MLASQTENGGAGNIRMVNVASEQAAQVVGIFACATASAFVHQKFDPVNISKHPGRRRPLLRGAERKRLQFAGLPFAVETDQLGNLAAIDLRRRETQLFLESLL